MFNNIDIKISFIFDKLFKIVNLCSSSCKINTILENVRFGKPDATDEEVMQALKDAQCMDIIDKFKDGVHTMRIF